MDIVIAGEGNMRANALVIRGAQSRKFFNAVSTAVLGSGIAAVNLLGFPHQWQLAGYAAVAVLAASVWLLLGLSGRVQDKAIGIKNRWENTPR